MKYKAIIFDFGGVIINIDFTLTYEAFSKLGIQNLEEKFAQSQQSDLFDKFEKGELSSQSFRESIRKMLGSDISDAKLDKAWNKMLLDIPKQRIEIIKQLKEKYQCVLLSNTNKIHYDFYRLEFEAVYGYEKFSDLFHNTYFSHEIGMRKPDKEIYDYVLKDLNLKPEEVLFIDDTQQNIVAAKALNWNTILWGDEHHLNELL